MGITDYVHPDNPNIRHVTDTEKAVWNAKETPAGALEKADMALLEAMRYTNQKETEIQSIVDSKDSRTLQSANDYTDAALAAGVAASIPIVNISDFETFNPSTSLVNSTTGKTFTLAEGESCQFKSAYNANGKPWMGSGTLGVTNNSLSAIYYWSGTITRLYSTYYMVTAYGANTTTGRPQGATRVYYGSSRYDWIVNTDFSSRSTSGYTKLPSGVMIQWGTYTPNVNAAYTVTFPLSFTSVYSAVTNCGDASITTNAATTAAIYSITVSDMTTLSRYAAYGGAFNWTQAPVRWIAIGTWK